MMHTAKPHQTLAALLMLACALPAHAQSASDNHAPNSDETDKLIQAKNRPEAIIPTLPELPYRLPVQLPEAEQEAAVKQIDEAGLLAQPPLLNLLLGKSVRNNDMNGIAVLLPVYRKLPADAQDATLLAFAESKYKMYQGDFAAAVRGLRALIAEHPDADAVRLHLAIALFYDKQDRAALDQFDKLLAETQLPAAEKSLIEQFRTQLQQRHQWQFSGGINYTHEPNINNAPAQTQHGNFHTEPAKQANGVVYQFGVEKDWALPHGWLVKFNSDLYGKHYPAAKKHNDLLISAGAGIGFRNGRTEASLVPFINQRFWQGDNAERLSPYSRGLGITWQLSRQLNSNWRISQHARIEQTTHRKRFRFDGVQKQIGHTLMYQPNARQAWFGGIDYQHDRLHDEDLSSHQWTASLGWIQEWYKGFSTRSRIAYSHQQYHAPTPIINKTRHDRRTQLHISAWHRNVHFWGITPRLTWQHIRNHSNVFLYDYRKNNFFIEFSKTF